MADLDQCFAYHKWCVESGMCGGMNFIHYHVWAYLEEHPEVLTMFCVDGVIKVKVYVSGAWAEFTLLSPDGRPDGRYRWEVV